MHAINDIPLIDISKSETGCCALIEPAAWDKQTFIFKDKLFAKAQTRSFLHVPLNMDVVMKNAQAKIETAGAGASKWIILSQDTSAWHADHYFAVTKEVPGLETTKLTGTFVTKVFEGPYRDAHKWYSQLNQYAKSMGKPPLATYFFYTTCPNCAKTYGKNYVVGFAQIA